MKRRTFIQGAMLAGCALPALAAGPQLLAHLQLKAAGRDVWTAELSLENVGSTAVDVLVETGSQCAVEIASAPGKVQFATVRPARPEFMTRAGPRRLWKPLAPAQTLALPTQQIRSVEPIGPLPARATLLVKVKTAQGPLQLVLEGVSIPAP